MTNGNAIARLISGLRREPHDFRPSLQVFPDLNVGRLAADMRLGDLGKERGERNEPPADSTTMDDVELQILERIESEKRIAHATMLDELQVYAKRLAGLEFEGRFSTIRQAAPAAVGEFKAEAVQGRNELFALRRHLKDVEAEREEFRRRNNLKRAARVQSGGSLTLKLGVLLVLLVVEIGLNSIFLAKGNDLGIFGGAAEALVFAFLNVLVSFAIAAVGVRQLYRRAIGWKVIGLFALLSYLAFAVLLNLALAHYREVSGTLLEGADRAVVERLLTTPWALMELKSWLFFGIGLSFSAIAFGDAFLVFDPYPGYGALQKRLDAAHQEYIDCSASLIENLKAIRDDAISAMEDANRDLSIRRSEHDAILEGRSRLVQLFTAHQEHLERAARALLAAYRDANSRARTPGSAPQRFGTSYQMERVPVLAEMADTTSRDDLRRSIADAQSMLEKQVEAIHTEFENAMRSYREIDELLPETDNAPTQLKAA